MYASSQAAHTQEPFYICFGLLVTLAFSVCPVTCDPFTYVTWRIHMCEVTHSYEWRDSSCHSQKSPTHAQNNPIRCKRGLFIPSSNKKEPYSCQKEPFSGTKEPYPCSKGPIRCKRGLYIHHLYITEEYPCTKEPYTFTKEPHACTKEPYSITWKRRPVEKLLKLTVEIMSTRPVYSTCESCHKCEIVIHMYSFICEWFISDMTHPYATWLIHMRHDSFTCELCHKCEIVIHVYSFICEWFICDMTHPYTTWLIHLWVVSQVWNSHPYVLIHMWHDSSLT